ncbi:MAG: hypothetical protein IPP19_01740 [Verrucomicrobia bacterium]|nr:hypothetical protein [Verrucomicrobiota bacterium]
MPPLFGYPRRDAGERAPNQAGINLPSHNRTTSIPALQSICHACKFPFCSAPTIPREPMPNPISLKPS